MSHIGKSRTFQPAHPQSWEDPAEGFLKNWGWKSHVAFGAVAVRRQICTGWDRVETLQLQRWAVIAEIGVLLHCHRCNISDLGMFFSPCRARLVSLVTLVLLESLAQL